jgi:peptidoglycan/xylan/chitin deacetylase (PgdA/CDA1 family)
MPIGNHDLIAACGKYVGVNSLLAALPTRSVLLVLNYHRIGNAGDCPYDSEVFSATADTLDDQVRFLKRRFHIASIDEAVEIVRNGKFPRSSILLLTFDDGYLDNYQSAFPILAAHKVQGAFFLPTAFVGTNRTPWWDAIAFIVKHSRRRKFRLTYPAEREIDLDAHGVSQAVRWAIALYKSEAARDPERFFAMLEDACGTPRPDGAERCFLNWEEAAEMAAGGMAIGSHTHNHEILSKLSERDQFLELSTSKRILEERLGVPVRALAYPVGLRDSFSAQTQAAAGAAGYAIAFSFYGGFNLPGRTASGDVRRVGVMNPTSARFQFQTSLAGVTGKYWF